ncbi:MAG: YdeI/OmpD-associated family protein [Waterburya sp.]
MEWIKNAKQLPTRNKRIAKTVELAAQNLRVNF